MTRNLLTGAGALIFLSFASSAMAQDWRLSSMMTPDSFEGLAYERFADLAQEYTSGDVTVRVFPNEQLGNMETVVEQLSQNIIQIAPSHVGFLSRWEDGVKFAAAPFLFDDFEHWSKFIRGDLFQGWLDNIEEQANIMILGDIPSFPRGSYRTLLSREPIESASDLRGVRVRQYQDELIVSAWEHLGAEVRVLPWGDVYDGINRGIVDAVTSPAELIPSMRFYEVAPNIIRTDEYPQAVAWMMNKDAWDSLSTEDQKGLLRAHEEAAAYARQLIEEQSRTLVSELEQIEGVSFNTDFDVSPWVESMQNFYDQLDAAGKLPAGLLGAVDAAR